MLLQLFILLLPIIWLLSRLRSNTVRSCPGEEDNKGQSDNKPKVVTAGPMQSVVNLYRILWSRGLPNYELSQKISQECGKVAMFTLPFKRPVFLNIADLSVAKSIMSSSAWSNKFPEDEYFRDFLDKEPYGLIFGNDGYWKEGRKVTLKLLHQLGFFREEKMEKIIQFEAVELVQEFQSKIQVDGGDWMIMKVHQSFQIYTLNTVYQVMLGGKRFEPSDPIAHMLLSAANGFNEEYNHGSTLLDIAPWLRHLPFFTFCKSTTVFNQVYKDFFQKQLIEPRRKAGNYKTDPADFVDHFLLEIDRRVGDNPCYLNDVNFMACMRDLIAGALDTTNASLEHGILHVCLQPGIQTKVQDEIDQVIGTAREPCYEDHKRMPYTQAVLWEILRYSTPAAVTSRCPIRDVELHGSIIPKDSKACINLYAIHRSTEVWTDPHHFRPERFLNEKNELVDLDKVMPFGYGKRLCVGEFVAKISLFIFFVSLLQKFSFELSEAHGPPCMKNKMGMSHGPFPYYVKVTNRRWPVRE